MKSSNPSLRRVAFAAAVLAAGNFAFAQSSTASSTPGASNSSNGMQSSDQSGSNASSSNGNNNSSNSSSNDQSSMSSNSDNNSSGKDKLSWSDRRFVKKAAEDGETEVAIAQLAAQKASNPEVRQFAQQMVNDHMQANQQLMSLASQKNVKLDQDDATKDRTYKRLSKASGNDFDREFVDHMVDEHEKDVRLFQKESQKAKDPDLKQFASSTLPTLQQHLQHVQQLQQSIMPTGNEANSGYSNSSNSSTSNGSSASSNGSSSSSNGANTWNGASSSNTTGSNGSASNPGTSASSSSSTSSTR